MRRGDVHGQLSSPRSRVLAGRVLDARFGRSLWPLVHGVPGWSGVCVGHARVCSDLPGRGPAGVQRTLRLAGVRSQQLRLVWQRLPDGTGLHHGSMPSVPGRHDRLRRQLCRSQPQWQRLRCVRPSMQSCDERDVRRWTLRRVLPSSVLDVRHRGLRQHGHRPTELRPVWQGVWAERLVRRRSVPTLPHGGAMRLRLRRHHQRSAQLRNVRQRVSYRHELPRGVVHPLWPRTDHVQPRVHVARG